jgi:hypothetical protein
VLCLALFAHGQKEPADGVAMRTFDIAGEQEPDSLGGGMFRIANRGDGKPAFLKIQTSVADGGTKVVSIFFFPTGDTNHLPDAVTSTSDCDCSFERGQEYGMNSLVHVDLNQDGWEDVMLACDKTGGPTTYFRYWLFDPEGQTFEEGSKPKLLANPTVIMHDNLVLSSGIRPKGKADLSFERIYHLRKGRLRLCQELLQRPTRKGNKYVWRARQGKGWKRLGTFWDEDLMALEHAGFPHGMLGYLAWEKHLPPKP